jgi:hypothetical protein
MTLQLFICFRNTFCQKRLACLNKIVYFSHGSAAQYKNRKNLLNLTLHEEDFGVRAELYLPLHTARMYAMP